METSKTKPALDLLFVGPSHLFDEIRLASPSHWKIRFVESIGEFKSNPESVSTILDASIREIIDLSSWEFDQVIHIACDSTGTNHIKINKMKSEFVKISSLRNIPEVLKNLTSAAEFSFGLLISLARQLVQASKSVELGEWNRSNFSGSILKGKYLGIIGLGRIGSAMSKYGKAFGMHVGFFDPLVSASQTEVQKYFELNELLAKSDFVSLHVPYLPDKSRSPILSKDHFSSFKQGSYFINTSRGELIDEFGLISELESGRILGAAVDVLSNEPDIKKNPLFLYSLKSKKNLIITPHIAGNSQENLRIAALGMLAYVLSYRKG